MLLTITWYWQGRVRGVERPLQPRGHGLCEVAGLGLARGLRARVASSVTSRHGWQLPRHARVEGRGAEPTQISLVVAAHARVAWLLGRETRTSSSIWVAGREALRSRGWLVGRLAGRVSLSVLSWLAASSSSHRRIVLLTLPQVNLQHVGQHEALAAVVTHVRPLPVMRSSVDPDIPGRGEPLLTDLTRVPLLVSILCRITRHLGTVGVK